MRKLASAFAVAVFSLTAGDALAASPDDLVAADVFIAACDEAKSMVDGARLEALLAKVQSQKAKAESQLDAANEDAAVAAEDLSAVAAQQGLKIENEIRSLNLEIAAASAKSDRLRVVMGREKSGPEFKRAFEERTAVLAKIAELEGEVAALQAMQSGVAAKLAEIEGASDPFAKAEIVLSIASDLGVARSFAFAGTAGRWTSAKLLVTSGEATKEAAESAVECIARKLATVEEAQEAEAKHLVDNLNQLGREMRAKGEQLTKAKKAAQDAFSSLFTDSGKRAERAVNHYWVVIGEYLAIGERFQAQVDQLAGKGIQVEAWMTELTGKYKQAKAIVAEARAKGAKR